MADTAVTTASIAPHGSSVRVGPIWVGPDTAYVLYKSHAVSSQLVYRKTTDGGTTWGSEVEIKEGNVRRISVWYDQWTPGNAGTLIHIAYIDTDDDDAFYRSLNTNDDTLSSEVTVFEGSTFSTVSSWEYATVDIVRARGGNLYIGFWGDPDGEYGFYRSTDDGLSWTARADVADGNAVDGILLMPGNETDEDDIWCIYWDRSADALSLKVYDNSGDSWAETAIASSMVDGPVYYQMSAAPRHSDNHVILAAWSELDAATADLKVWDITNSGTITAMTNVLTDTDNSAQVAVLINQQNSDIYAAYLKGGTWTDSVDVKYKKSTDGGTTWGAETSYSEAAADDLRGLWAGISVNAAGGRFQPIFSNVDLNDLFVNLTNDVEITSTLHLPLRDAYAGAAVDAVPLGGSAKA